MTINDMRLSRRRLLTASASLTVIPLTGHAADAPPSPLRLWYRQPATRWEEALPLGNGRLGAMVFGRVAQERLQLNEDTLWSGGPYSADNPDALAALPQVRALIAAGDYKAATDLASAKMMGKPLSQMSYGTAGDLLLSFDGARAPETYERDLDLQTAVATTRLRMGGARLTRESFVSAPDQVVVFHAEGDTPFDFRLDYRGPQASPHPFPDMSQPAMPATPPAVDWLQTEAADGPQDRTRIVADGPDAVLITGRNEPGPDNPAALTWAMRIVARGDGKVAPHERGLSVTGARRVTLLVAIATSFVDYHEVGADPVAAVRARTGAAARKPYAALKADHIRDHRRLFDGVTLELGGEAAATQSTDARLYQGESGEDPALIALYFQFARYLMISSSRPGGQPANLQGLWNPMTNPPWGSKYTVNINTEMNYWPADPAGLGACVEPLLRMVEDLSVTGAKTARVMYGARGWVCHHNTDIWRATAPVDGPIWGLWPCGGAWLCNSLWDHYDYSRDPEVLRRLYPLMKGSAQFFLDTLIEDPQGRGLITSPSLSPESVLATSAGASATGAIVWFSIGPSGISTPALNRPS